MGREKESSVSPQCIGCLKEREVMSPGSDFFRIEEVCFPFSFFTAQRIFFFPIFLMINRETFTFCECAKPSAAFVGFPS